MKDLACAFPKMPVTGFWKVFHLEVGTAGPTTRIEEAINEKNVASRRMILSESWYSTIRDCVSRGLTFDPIRFPSTMFGIIIVGHHPLLSM